MGTEGSLSNNSFHHFFWEFSNTNTSLVQGTHERTSQTAVGSMARDLILFESWILGVIFIEELNTFGSSFHQEIRSETHAAQAAKWTDTTGWPSVYSREEEGGNSEDVWEEWHPQAATGPGGLLRNGAMLAGLRKLLKWLTKAPLNE